VKVNYVLMYGTPYLKYREFETFEDVSKFLVNKRIVNYSIFKKLEDKEEVEMIYRDNDIRVLLKENENKEKVIKAQDNIINRIKSIYQSLRFSAPENYYIFIEQLGEVLKELKGSDKEWAKVNYMTY